MKACCDVATNNPETKFVWKVQSSNAASEYIVPIGQTTTRLTVQGTKAYQNREGSALDGFEFNCFPDGDGDGNIYPNDNCLHISNADQLNSDRYSFYYISFI